MSFLIRMIPVIFLLISPFFSTTHAESSDKTEPIAQVYEVQGMATVKSGADGNTKEVKKGCLLGRDDSLTLDSNASIALYFKNGGKKEVRAKDKQVLYKVTDLIPQAQAYGQSVPMFGATRGLDIPEAVSQAAGFFYPQEAVILESPPVIEFTLFKGSGEEVVLGGASVEIIKAGMVLDFRKFDSLEYGPSYTFQSQKLKEQTEYSVELRLELQNSLGNVLTISFPLYIAGTSDRTSVSGYAPFTDSVYRSFESTSMDYKGKKHTITAIKQLARRGGSPQPIVVIELFIP